MHLLRHLSARAAAVRLVLAALALLTAGCAARLDGPVAGDDRRSVALLEHGRHSSLLLARADQSRVRYAYGDWAWYVEEETGVGAALRALLRDSPAGFGRRQLGPARPDVLVEREVGVGIKRIYRFEVPAERVEALLDRLDRQFAESPQPPYFSEARQLSFVPHPRPYRFGYNSNHMVADWLRELGVEVSGNPALGRWRLQGGGSLD